jgi:diguanylate cyclase (GGDEF)-like protein
VNDTDGHLAGDDLIRSAAGAIAAAAGDRAVVGRIGGDEFAAIVPPDAAPRLLEVEGASAGIALFPRDGESADALLAHADSGLYESKRHRGTDRVAARAHDVPPAEPRHGDETVVVPASGLAIGGLRMAALIHLTGFVLIAVYGIVTAGWPLVVLGLFGAAVCAVAAACSETLSRRPAFHVVYAAATFGTVLAALVVDGGPGGPVGSGFLLAVLAVAMTARPRDLITLGLGLTAALVLAALLTDWGPPGYTPIMLAITACAAAGSCAQQSVLVAQRRRLRELSWRDPLTGCLNRHGMTQRVIAAATSGEPAALITVDLDGFKAINDTFGHAAGDDLLRWVGRSIASCIRPGDAVARVGGDEFDVLLHAPFDEPVERVAALIEGVLRHRTGVSIGWAAYPHEAVHFGDVKKLADERMYAAKRAAAAPLGS